MHSPIHPDTKPHDMDRYTIKQACEIIGVSRPTLYRLIDDGLLERTTTRTSPRGRVYITGESVRRYLARRRAEHGEPAEVTR